MPKLSKKDRQRFIKILEDGEEIPIDYKNILFPPEKREYELVYVDKEPEEDILADTMAVPLQPIKTFGENGKEWTNKLIFGDNLQVMKSLIDDPEVKGQVKLIYIDPPFATKQEFRGSQDQKAYQDKIAGAKFIEFLRKRLIFLRELLADDGSIYVHIDQKKGHYIKVLLDEVFGEHNFENEIIWQKIKSVKSQTIGYGNVTDYILFYRKSPQLVFNQTRIPHKEEYLRTMYRHVEKDGRRYRLHDFTQSGSGPARKFGRKGYINPPAGKHWIWSQENIDEGMAKGLIVFSKSGMPQIKRYLDEVQGEALNDLWNDINPIGSVSNERVNYPTQKPEALLERIINTSSDKGDIVLDAFTGSGTTCATAEKLNRRWIGIDCGKLAIYTIQKRMLNLKTEIGNKGKHLNPKPFALYHAGLYDFSILKKLPWKDWRLFALHLFNCRDEKHTLSGIELDGYKGRSDVLVFNYQQGGGKTVLDYGFIDDLHSMICNKAGDQFFIIAPAASVVFLEDYIDKGSVRYYILRIPYSIINELHNRDFEAIKQPIDESQVNDTVDAVGFDFIRPPKVECEYSIKQIKGQTEKVVSIKIKVFKSEAMIKGASTLANRESLSMVMIDCNYGEEIFNLEKVYYASDIEKNNWEVHIPINLIKNQIMVVYLDIYGNEYREVKTIKDFKSSVHKKVLERSK